MSELNELKKAVETHGEMQKEFVAKNNERLDALEKSGTVAGDLVDDVKDLSAKLTEQEATIEKLHTVINRASAEKNAEDQRSEKCKASEKFIRKGEGALSLEEKALISSDDPEAGYAISDVQGEMFDETIRELSPIMQVARVTTITKGNRVRMTINKKGGLNAKWTNETTATTETGNPSLGEMFININKADALALASEEQLEDADFNIEEWLRIEANEDLASLANSAFFTGDGIEKPFGFLGYVDAVGDRSIPSVDSGHATQFTRDGIVRLAGTPKAPYRQGAVFMATRESITEIRLLKDDEGRYSLINDFSQAPARTLLGYPLLDAVDMPQIATNAYPLAFGNFNQGYHIINRKGVTVKRFLEKFDPYIGFKYYKRVGGDLRKGEALAVQKISA